MSSVSPGWLQHGPFGWAWLSSDGLFGLTGWSRLGRAVGPSLFVGEEAGMAQITSSIGAQITAQGNKHILRGRSNDQMWMTALVDYIANTVHAKTVGLSFTNIELGRSGRDVAGRGC